MTSFIDMVCGKAVTDADVQDKGATAATKRYHEGQWFYFCSLACRQKFIANPEAYIAKSKQAQS